LEAVEGDVVVDPLDNVDKEAGGGGKGRSAGTCTVERLAAAMSTDVWNGS